MNKKVLITGGAKGLGRNITETFAKNNYDVIITYLTSETEALDLKKLESKYSIKVQLYKIDLNNEEEIDSLIKSINHLDVLINNAAFNEDKDLFEKKREDFLKTLSVNLVAPFLLSKYAYPLLKRSSGCIINIASTNGIDTMYKSSLDYDASKAGLINLTKSLSAAFGNEVRVNAIAPGWIETHNTMDMEPKFREKEEQKIVMKRFANGQEIADLVFFAASSTYMTGSILRIDGGQKYGN